MDSTTTLKSITLGQQSCKVFGRLLRIWDAVNMKSKFPDPLISIDGVILDEDSKRRIYVYIFTDVAAVDRKNKSYIYHHQNYMLQFKHSTKVHRLESRGTDIPKFSFKFCPFDKLPEMNTLAKPLQDCGFTYFHLLINQNVVSKLFNNMGAGAHPSKRELRTTVFLPINEQTQEIRLWGHHGETFDEQTVFRKAQEGIVVGIFAGVTASDFLGNLTASSTSATKIYIDLDISDVANFRSSYQWESPSLQQQLPQVFRLSPIQAAGKLYTL
ncbi:hypothetical protein BRADI_1g40688v3 [Brachypodium distachyon]|uniref:DUF223 domain-containing protein n=1 Tax=Brachypodium distachyon TaxID=15368 RepID=A0A0Q3H5U5_BRADI|nr:hypothetical protein BRADI_1g40688v3 [Brachypodium distachyon]